MSPHETRPESPVETPEEPFLQWKGILSFWPQLQVRTSASADTSEESREAPRKSRGDWTFLKPHERVSVVPIVTRGEPLISCRNPRKTRRFSPQCEMRPFSTVAAREKSYLSSYASKGSLTPLMQLKNFPYIPISTREEP